MTNHKGTLYELCQKHGWPEPVFSHTKSGDDHIPTFTCIGTVDTGKVMQERSCAEDPTKRRPSRRWQNICSVCWNRNLLLSNKNRRFARANCRPHGRQILLDLSSSSVSKDISGDLPSRLNPQGRRIGQNLPAPADTNIQKEGSLRRRVTDRQSRRRRPLRQ